MDLRVFFPAGAPPYAPAPNDSALTQRIHKLIEFAVRNGPSFVEEVRTKQGHNPEYAFLNGGEGASYYAWTLYSQLQANRPVAQPPLSAPASESPALAALPEEVRTGWAQVLNLLNGTKESINNSQAWFMACAAYAAGMAEMTAAAATSASDHKTALHLLWLASDILHKAKSNRPQGTTAEQDPVALAFQPFLGKMLRRVYTLAGQDAEKQQAATKVANIWSERRIFPSAVVETMVMEMMGLLPPPLPAAAAAPWSAAPPATAPTTQSQPQYQQQPLYQQPLPPRGPPMHASLSQQQSPVGPPHSTPGFPPHHPQQPQAAPGMRPLQPPPHFLPHGFAPRPPPPFPGQPHPPQFQPPPPPPPEPEEPPFDPLSFPPGLIPKLVEESLQTDKPYSPLSTLEIERSEVPPPPTLDPYLKAQLDKFYAQLSDFRPEVAFSDIEMEPPRRRYFVDKGVGGGGGEGGEGGYASRGGAPPVDDGSGGFGPSGGSGGRGLGYGSSGGDGGAKEDVFASYRNMRSQGYHAGIARRG